MRPGSPRRTLRRIGLVLGAAFALTLVPIGQPRAAAATTIWLGLVKDNAEAYGYALGPGNVDTVLIDNGVSGPGSTIASDAGGAWGYQSIPGRALGGDIAVDTAGHVFATTDISTVDSRDPGVAMSTNVGGSWITYTAPIYGAAGSGFPRSTHVAVAANGDVYVAWNLKGTDFIYVRQWTAGTWGPITEVAPAVLHSVIDYTLQFNLVMDAANQPHFLVSARLPLLPVVDPCVNEYCTIELAPDGSGGWTMGRLGPWAGAVEAVPTPAGGILATVANDGLPIEVLTKASGAWTAETIPGTNAFLPASVVAGPAGPVVFFQNNTSLDPWVRRADRGVAGWTVTQLPYQGRPYGAADSANATHVAFAAWKAYPNGPGMAAFMAAPDTTGPSTGSQVQNFRVGAITGSTVSANIAWIGRDALSGVSRYELQRRIGTGSWTSLGSSFTASSVAVSFTPSSTTLYQFRTRAWDKAGNVGGWNYGVAFNVLRYQDGSTTIHYSGTWSTSYSSSYSGGATKYASVAGRYATFTFTGWAFAWVAATGPTRGSARVYVDGVWISTISLHTSTTSYRKVVFQFRGPTRMIHTFKLLVLGSTGHPRVDLDSILVLR